ncbi:MAG TPA: ABC transporter ATP-binding protein [Nocardioidaceae bacterium]|nr:ABC transporter ATP-binding protein [Nocardioidaceae bacterium]
MSVTAGSAGQVTSLGAPGATAIEAEGLVRTYGSRTAVDGIDLQVPRGAVLGLLGPNGAGKTTLIRLLSTLLRPDSGTFSIAGVPHTDPRGIRLRVGVLPESPGYPRSQTSEEWLTYQGRLYGSSRPEAQKTARRLLDEVGLGDRAGSMIGGLSRGMRQRLGIARALVNDPSVVFLDEPTLGLDPLGQRQILDLVTRIARERGVTVVLSTHILAEVEQVCSQVVILNRGRIVAEGTTTEVVRRAAAPRAGVVRVPTHLRDEALHTLTSLRLVADDASLDGSPDEVPVRLPGDEPVEPSAEKALRGLLDAGIPVLGFSLEGGRLSDAFLAVTKEADDG